MGEVVVNGCRLAYQQVGEGPDLVFVHGLAASRAFWFAQYALPLAQHFRVGRGDEAMSRLQGAPRPSMKADAASIIR